MLFLSFGNQKYSQLQKHSGLTNNPLFQSIVHIIPVKQKNLENPLYSLQQDELHRKTML